jgi:hypothetical protein
VVTEPRCNEPAYNRVPATAARIRAYAAGPVSAALRLPAPPSTRAAVAAAPNVNPASSLCRS